jgi:VWFA-related protein
MKDKAFVVAFDSRVHLIHDLSDNVPALCKSVSSIEAGGEPALYDALIFSSNKLRTIPESQVTRRAIILISDGVDTASRALMHDGEEAAARAETVIVALSTNDPVFHPQGEIVLDALTSPTGGGILPARDESQLTDAFGHIEKVLRNQYALAYQPAAFNLDGGYRRVEIVPRRHGFKVQCRKGYFASQGQGAAPDEARATN